MASLRPRPDRFFSAQGFTLAPRSGQPKAAWKLHHATSDTAAAEPVRATGSHRAIFLPSG
jgi:hypothetical protein